MKLRNLLTLISLSLLISLPAVAWAQKGRNEAKSAQENADPAEQMRSRAEETNGDLPADQPAEMREEARSRRYEGREMSIEEGAGFEEARGRGQDMNDAAGAEKQAERRSNFEDPQTKGSEQAQEMRARRDERKAIKEEYKSDRTPGQEADSAPIRDDDIDESAEVAKDKPKKSWWKFWED